MSGGMKLKGATFGREGEARLIGRGIEGYRTLFAGTGLDLPVSPNREDLASQAGGAAG